MEERVSLYKSGLFYNCYRESAYIVHKLMGYKVVFPKESVGFPEKSLEKVLQALHDANVSFSVYEKDTLTSSFDGDKTSFKELLRASKEELKCEERKSEVIRKINSLPLNKLLILVEELENV